MIRPNARLSLLSAALLLAIAGAADAASPRRLAVDGRTTGEITGSDRVNLNDGSRSVGFEVELREGQAVAIEAGAVFCGRAALFAADEAGRDMLVRAFEPSECRTQDGRQVFSQSLVAPRTGRYTLAFSGRSGSDYGPFSLSLKAIALQADRELAVGDDVHGLLDGDSKSLRLKITETGRYVIDLRSSEFDPVLRLAGEGVERENDDAGEDLNSRLVAYLQPGDYRLEVAKAGGEGGMYQLQVARSDIELPEGTRLQNDGDLPTGGITGVLEGEVNRYRLKVAARTRYDFAVDSSDFDPRIAVTGPGTALTDDDSGEGTNARLAVTLEPGEYAVAIDDVSGSQAGAYTIRTTAAPAAGPVLRARVGTVAEGSLGAGEQHRYQFDVEAAGQYVIGMSSADLDSIVHVLRDGENVGTDDDGAGEGNDSRLEVTLQPGRHEIIVTAFDGGSGRYRLGVGRR